MSDLINLNLLVNSIVYSVLGVVVFWLSFIIIDKITPQDLWLEIVKHRNQPLAILMAAICLGIAIIIAAAIH